MFERSLLLSVMRCQCLKRIFLRFGVAGLKVVTKGKTLLDVAVLFCKALDRNEKCTSAKIFSASS